MAGFTAVGNAFRMLPSKFNIIRVCIYTTVILWSIICLALAAHFVSVLSSSDLTRFVPFAIFVAVASILIMFSLIAFGIWSNMNPITVRIELACLGLVGTLWLALGAFLASSESQNADVECFASDDSSTPTDDGGFTTETYQAQYRVLLAFSLFNLILIAVFLALLLWLAFRRNLAGDKAIWYTPVPVVAWFGPIKQTKKPAPPPPPPPQQHRLPAPVTEKPTHSRTRTASRLSALFGRRSAERVQPQPRELAKPSYTKPVDEHYVWVPEQPKPGAARLDRPRLDRDTTRTTAATGTTRLERDNTRSTAVTGTTRLERDNTRSTMNSRSGLITARDDPPTRNNTRSTTASRRDRDPRTEDRFTEAPVRTSSRRNREQRDYERDRDTPSRNNTRSTQATRTTSDSRRGRQRDERASERAVVVPAPAAVARQTSGSRKPDYYRRDLSPRR